uniref:Lipoprotein n=1 Tax=Streptomyces sp. NBC_00049 TaxID=2903617 RepID=A0AAU2K2G0_9ACTN
MRTTARTLTAAAITTTLVLAASGCGQSYDDIVRKCHKILVERPEGETGKPAACSDVKEEDYTVISASAAMERLGWTDKNGRFDEQKMLQDPALIR